MLHRDRINMHTNPLSTVEQLMHTGTPRRWRGILHRWSFFHTWYEAKGQKTTVNVSYLAWLCFGGKWFLNKLAKIWLSAFPIVPIHLHIYFTLSDVIELKRRSLKKRWIGYTAKCTCYTLTVKSDVWNVLTKSARNVACCDISIYRSYIMSDFAPCMFFLFVKLSVTL